MLALNGIIQWPLNSVVLALFLAFVVLIVLYLIASASTSSVYVLELKGPLLAPPILFACADFFLLYDTSSR